MDIQITGRNVKIVEGLEDYTRRKVDRLDRYLPNIREIRVDLARQHNRRGENMSIAQITVHHERGAILRAEEKTTGDLNLAIDNAVDKMYRQIMRFKGKKRAKSRRERFSPTIEEMAQAEPLPMEANNGATTSEAVKEDGKDDSVVRRKDVLLIPMDEEEAIEQMELLGHNFFMFFNATTGKINVVYRRADEGYGLLEPLGDE